MSSRATSPGRSRSTRSLPPMSFADVGFFHPNDARTYADHQEMSVKVFTHGIGGAQDLPISLPFALAGGAAALAVSFAVLVLAWRSPRFDGAHRGRPLPAPLARAVDGGWLTWLLRAWGLAFAAYVVWAATA